MSSCLSTHTAPGGGNVPTFKVDFEGFFFKFNLLGWHWLIFLRPFQMVRGRMGILCKTTTMTRNNLSSNSKYIMWSVSSQDYSAQTPKKKKKKEQCCQQAWRNGELLGPGTKLALWVWTFTWGTVQQDRTASHATRGFSLCPKTTMGSLH